MDIQQYAKEFEKVLHHECARVVVEDESDDDASYCWAYVFRAGICGYVSCAIDENLMDTPTVSIGVHLRDVGGLSESTLLKLLQNNVYLLNAYLIILGVDTDEPHLVIHSKFKIADFPPQEFRNQIELMLSQYSRVMSGGDSLLCG